jgi:hypothetical protein
MDNLDDLIASKCDAPLTAMWAARDLEPSARIPIVVRGDPGYVIELANFVTALGATVRHRIELFGAVAAWVPIDAIVAIVRDPRVRTIELEQAFRITATSAIH